MTETTTTEAPQVEATAAAPAAQPVWTDALDDAGKAYVSAKGYKEPGEVLAALKGYEPPESADKYDLPVPDGESAEFAKSVAPLMHKAGLNAAQAKALADGWNAMQGEARKAAQAAEANAATEANALAERQQADLKREWGQAFDANVELSRRAIRAGMAAAGLQDDAAAGMIDTLEKAHGFGAVHKFFAALGAPMAEGTAKGMGQPPAVQPKSFYDKSNMNP